MELEVCLHHVFVSQCHNISHQSATGFKYSCASVHGMQKQPEGLGDYSALYVNVLCFFPLLCEFRNTDW